MRPAPFPDPLSSQEHFTDGSVPNVDADVHKWCNKRHLSSPFCLLLINKGKLELVWPLGEEEPLGDCVYDLGATV